MVIYFIYSSVYPKFPIYPSLLQIPLFLILSNLDSITPAPQLPASVFPPYKPEGPALIYKLENHRSEELYQIWKSLWIPFLKIMKWKIGENIVGKMGFCLHLLKESFSLSDLSQMAREKGGEEAQAPSKQANVSLLMQSKVQRISRWNTSGTQWQRLCTHFQEWNSLKPWRGQRAWWTVAFLSHCWTYSLIIVLNTADESFNNVSG